MINNALDWWNAFNDMCQEDKRKATKADRKSMTLKHSKPIKYWDQRIAQAELRASTVEKMLENDGGRLMTSAKDKIEDILKTYGLDILRAKTEVAFQKSLRKALVTCRLEAEGFLSSQLIEWTFQMRGRSLAQLKAMVERVKQLQDLPVTNENAMELFEIDEKLKKMRIKMKWTVFQYFKESFPIDIP